MREKALIARIRRAAIKPSRVKATGIGDDCAVLQLPQGHEALITTDFSLENVHFRREWHPAYSVGHRCLARGLSDIAAMGGIPQAAFLSLAVPAELPQSWVDGFVRGLLKLAARFSTTLAGGDTAQSPSGVLADIVVVGSVPKGRAVLRSGARGGDLIYVTGTLGLATAALEKLRQGETLRPTQYRKHFYPEPRIAVGEFLRQHKLATAMIDISDGLSTDLGHICEESGVGATVEAERLPIAAKDYGLKLALHGGDEYELLFTARPSRRIPQQIAGVPITAIGEITRGRKMKLASPDGKTEVLAPQGWEHFG
jgi:thiamine-monophosphate kinase